MVLVWVLTVSSLRPSSRAASVVDSPSASSCRISRWRRVSAAVPPLPARAAGSTKRLRRRRPRRPPRSAPRRGELWRRRRWRRPGCASVGRMALGPRRRGRRSRGPGCALRSARIASVPSRRRRRRRRPRRMSTIATSKSPTSRSSSTASPPSSASSTSKRSSSSVAHAEPDQRVAVDHQAASFVAHFTLAPVLAPVGPPQLARAPAEPAGAPS